MSVIKKRLVFSERNQPFFIIFMTSKKRFKCLLEVEGKTLPFALFFEKPVFIWD